MIDVLSYQLDLPLMLTRSDMKETITTKFNTRRIIDKNEVREAFNISRILELEEPNLLRALGWLTKGKVTQNNLDRFLAYWNVIEILGTCYFTETVRTSGDNRTKNKIYQCFIDYFGKAINKWGIPDRWIDEMYTKRNVIVHGAQEVNLESIIEISNLLPLLEKMSNELISEILERKIRN